MSGHELDVVQMGEIAAMLDLTRQRATELSLRKGFPEPFGELTTGRVWLASDVIAWADTVGRDVIWPPPVKRTTSAQAAQAGRKAVAETVAKRAKRAERAERASKKKASGGGGLELVRPPAAAAP